ncbi:uncharacterized protein LOC119395869 [Rhipicephalus sanguineus]|uniref:uncharacterized protein LOC119395869 n=1 Tax=Rhipicephalus sanguineus TaxID=34632 RepID=UPI0020C4C598|nr:uncharacterized protein LOC119395869 [Rhipicephalus sanguineus]
MYWPSTRTTLVVVSILCMYMNGFNLTSRLFGYYYTLRRYEVAQAVPDVYDLSKWVNNRKTSDRITMGLAGVSLLFDVALFTGALKNDVFLIEIAGLWGSIDCVTDAVIGFLSANYTLPAFLNKDRAQINAYMVLEA